MFFDARHSRMRRMLWKLKLQKTQEESEDTGIKYLIQINCV